MSIFERAPDDRARAIYVDEHSPDCGCENKQVSEYCVDPVDMSESLDRLVVDPTHIERENGKVRLKTSFFSDAASSGASCLRRGRAKSEEYVATVSEILEQSSDLGAEKSASNAADGTSKQLYGIVNIPVSKIKSIMHENRDKKGNLVSASVAFCVYATGMHNKPHHADVMVRGVSSISRSQANRAGINLTKIINSAIESGNPIISAEEFKDIADLSKWSSGN